MKTPRQIAEHVAKINGPHNMLTQEEALRLAAEMARKVEFAPEGEHDFYRGQWRILRQKQPGSIESPNDGDYPWAKVKIMSGTVGGHTQWLNVTAAQAEHILAYLSEKNRSTT